MIKSGLILSLLMLLTLQPICGQTHTKDWAKFSRYQEANAALTEAPDVVFMGNSITANWAKFRPEFFSSNNYAGRGISGQTSSQMLVRFRQDVLELKPKVVVILAGTNDIALNNGPITLPQIVGNIASMCELAEHNGIDVVLCSVLPCKAYRWRKEVAPAPLIIEFNGLIKAYAQSKGYRYVDYHSAMTDAEGGLPIELSEDGCHPNVEGYLIMERVLGEALNQQ